MIHNFSDKPSIFQNYIAEIRDADIQKDAMRFRTNLTRIGSVLGYELSKKLKYVNKIIRTPLGEASQDVLDETVVVASILRAGIPMHNGLLEVFDKAENAFISAYRKSHKNGDFEVHVEYLAAPNLDGKTLIIADPMLATGSSMVLVYKALLQKGTPKKVHIVSAIGSVEAVAYIQAKLPQSTEIWIGAIDQELTAQSYIVPGLGDAGDLAYGSKSNK
ncbi:uracil phosphoribosyltransferase [Putridiphycobacter roseus]|uniref:Uracil phosphoribosyltransferase n=1 Tax=Putridiphycobacter roseus TaxID=2219161 RepID=A0A2W1N4D1_9FLAO|nr:uracil phosphoribosyltransferase [Putridiphycobacter roseus]PZE18450.1 uracil phosphoribosyltransferase [Putridiphycobacter roseus]